METKRIYIGNLDPSVDEYAVIKLFEPFGKIVVFDFMFFLHGPKKGQPRGYCFLEYEKKPEALTAISALNGKRIKGRPLVVSSANKNTLPSSEEGGGKHHRSYMHRPTSFGLLRNQKMTQSKSTDAKILAIEQKLAALQKPAQSSSTDTPSSLASSSSSSLPHSSQTRRYRPY
ncbi:hypothetical protein BCR42DRAFT_406783 [Absidia repens]|uniref:RRM domain-containing protein n=1 Tax=Absidia repens TaxID=90262 RepID=A0A1X2IRD5_9FUNG|nr:hypothetical protein BCR42DRAFT_406783 [Absidia repens]